MKKFFGMTILALSFIIASCGGDDESGSDDTGGGEPEAIQATYRLTLNGNFTAQTHPMDYPAEATFGPIFGIAHGSNVTVFREGQLASDGFRALIADGNIGTLSQELTPADDGSNSDFVVSIATAGEMGATSSSAITVTVTPRSTFLSFAAKVNPSPDWFVGINNFNLLGDDNLLIENETIDLFPLDAGIDGGTTYTADPLPNSENISTINGEPFSMDNGGITILNPLATLTIERIN